MGARSSRLNNDGDARRVLRALLEELEAGACSPELALTRALLALREPSVLERALNQLAHERARSGAKARGRARERDHLEELRRLLLDHRDGAQRVAALLRTEEELSGAGSPDAQIAACRQLFDALVAHSEEASVALYSLGSPHILARATDEIVAYLAALGLLAPHVRALDLGCGIGRVAAALAPHLAHIDGVDLSPAMVTAAQRRCAELANVRISLCSGRDLRDFGARSRELVLAVDSMPYVVQAGDAITDALFAEVARVLTPGAHFVVLNFSYRGDLARDRAELAGLSDRHGYELERAGERPFRLWDAAAFVLRRADQRL